MGDYCFVILESINRVPFLAKYIANSNYTYDIVIWDRSANSNNPNAEHFYAFHYGEREHFKYLFKAIGYVKFSVFATKILRTHNYKGVFVFNVNTGLLCLKTLLEKYRNKYILDIRDYWNEHIKIIYHFEKKLINNSYANVISSAAYKRFLPEAKYTLTHNSQLISESTIRYFRNKGIEHKGVIILACIGGCKNLAFDKKIISYFANDNRFYLKYIGKGYDKLTDYCQVNGISNVYCEGMFPMEDTFKKYEDVDMILNMYGNNTPKLDYALSNKLYFAAQLGKPIIVCISTYMEEVAVKNGFGISIDINKESDKTRLYEFYNSLDYNHFINYCDRFLQNVSKDEAIFDKLISSFVND